MLFNVDCLKDEVLDQLSREVEAERMKRRRVKRLNHRLRELIEEAAKEDAILVYHEETGESSFMI